MAISTTDGWIGSTKQKAPIRKLVSRTSVANIPFSVFDLDGHPGKGTLAGTSASAGVVPTDATAGFPIIDFSSGVGYITTISFGNSVLSRLHLYDMLWKGGTYAYNSGTTSLSSQPAISSRCPDYPGSGTTFGNGIEIWVEVVTAHTSATAYQIQVTYTNSAGTAGRTSIVSVAQAAAALTVGKMFQLALQAGDSGVQKIESVIVTTGAAAAGTVNVLLLRPLNTDMRVELANGGGVLNFFDTAAPIIYSDSALFYIVQADSTATGLPSMLINIDSA